MKPLLKFLPALVLAALSLGLSYRLEADTAYQVLAYYSPMAQLTAAVIFCRTLSLSFSTMRNTANVFALSFGIYAVTFFLLNPQPVGKSHVFWLVITWTQIAVPSLVAVTALNGFALYRQLRKTGGRDT